MATSADRATLRTSEAPHLRPLARLKDFWIYREILVNLVRKELKVKYTKSVLGAAWSMLNPVFYLIIFSFVMRVLGRGIPHYPVYLLSGIIAWNFFSTSLTLATRSVVDNTSLVKKVYFPREILPLAAVGTSLVDFLLQYLVLIAYMVVFRYAFLGWNTLLALPAFVAMVIVTVAVSFWVSSVNVTYRDVQHLLTLLLLAWFWLTPIVYPGALLQQHLSTHRLGPVSLFHVYFINPLGGIIMGFQRAFYATIAPPGADGKATPVLVNLSLGQLWEILGLVILGGLVLLYACWRVYFRLSGDFAEEL